MLRSHVVMMAMSATSRGTSFDPVRVQKLLFLVDREAAIWLEGPHFDFKPYRYGPFDAAVYEELDALQEDGSVAVRGRGPGRAYALTESGHVKGLDVLTEIAPEARQYVREAARWVLSLSFRQLLSAIYRQYPDMAVKSIVPDLAAPKTGGLERPRSSPFLSGVARTLDLAAILDRRLPRSNTETDAMAIHGDWSAVGNDIRVATARFGVPTGQSDSDGS